MPTVGQAAPNSASLAKRAGLLALYLLLLVLAIGSTIELVRNLSLDVPAALLVALVIQTALLFWWTRQVTLARRRLRPKPDIYSVPHVDMFEYTPGGFTAAFTRRPLWLAKVSGPLLATGSPGALVLLPLALIAEAITFVRKQRGGTRIEVSAETITVDGKHWAWNDFGHFHLAEVWTINGMNIAILGYTCGNQSFAFGGPWPQQEAEEVAAALNAKLRAVRQSEGRSRVSPDQLRRARPTDF